MKTRLAPAVTTARFALPTDPAGLCLQHVRANPGITRTQLQRSLGFSQPTMHRLVSRLTEEGVLRATTMEATGTGRPSASLTVDGRRHLAVGAHVGLKRTQLVLTDLAGRTLAHDSFPLALNEVAPQDALPFIFQRLLHLTKSATEKTRAAEHNAQGNPYESLRGFGLAFSTDVSPDGTLKSPNPEWSGLHLPSELEPAFDGLSLERTLEGIPPICLGTGVSALAGMELAFRDPTTSPTELPSILYIYSREVLSYSWIINGGIHRPRVGHQSQLIAALLAKSNLSDSTTIFSQDSLPTHADDTPLHSHKNSKRTDGHPLNLQEDPLSVGHLLEKAAELEHPATSLDELVELSRTTPTIAKLLDSRAELLGELIDIAVQVTDPHEVVLAGETFTADPERTRQIAGKLTQNTGENGPARILKIHPAHPRATLDAAKMVALHPLWQSPL